MADQGEGFNLDDRDRLPWLEPAEEFEQFEKVPVQKVFALVLLGLALLGLIVGGGWWLKSRSQSAETGDVKLIPAPGGAYKIPAKDARAKKFAGEGDESYAASEGAETDGRIDPSKAPEMPMTGLAGATAADSAVKPPKTAPAKGEASAKIKDVTHAKAPVRAVPAASDSGGVPQIQLGAYASENIAQDMWKQLGTRFAELKGASHTVEPVVIANGKTLYRLRMKTAGPAESKALCGTLRVAGESCWVVP